MNETADPIRAWLVELLRGQASWRAIKASEYPDDLRNERSADALLAAASYAEAIPQLPDSLVNAVRGSSLEVHALAGYEVARVISRFGFNYGPPPVGDDFDRLFANIAHAMIDDIVEAERLDVPEIDE